jgi:hypothetical protein
VCCLSALRHRTGALVIVGNAELDIVHMSVDTADMCPYIHTQKF